MIRGIAFDLEGTAVNVEAAHHEGHLAMAKEFGLDLTLDEAYARLPHFIGGPNEKVCEDILGLLMDDVHSPGTITDMLVRDQFHYERLLGEMEIAPRPGFIRFCEVVRQAGIAVSIGSLTSQKQAMTLLENSGLFEFFDHSHIVLRKDVVNPKPSPDVFLKTATIMGISPTEQLVFEDSPRGVKAALAAGSRAIGMPVIIKGHVVATLVDAGVCRLFFDWRDINANALLRSLG